MREKSEKEISDTLGEGGKSSNVNKKCSKLFLDSSLGLFFLPFSSFDTSLLQPLSFFSLFLVPSSFSLPIFLSYQQHSFVTH